MDVKQWLKDRNEAFTSMDEKKIKAYCKKYEIEVPEDEDVFWAGVHKSICNLFLEVDTCIDIKQYNESYHWLIAHGYNPSIITGGDE